MAIASTGVWEVRTGGSDSNGGVFVSGSGTDYSQQDSAQLSLTDLATSGAGVTTVTSATGGFTSAMVGNGLAITSGTNFTAGIYQITAYTDTNEITVDRSPTPSAAGSGGSGNVGGALGTPGKIGALSTSEVVTGQKFWVKSGTYTLSTSTAGSGGPLNLTTNFNSTVIVIEGYETTRGDLGAKPVMDAGTQTSINIITAAGSWSDKEHYICNLKIDGQLQTGTVGFKSTANTNYLTTNFVCCEAVDCAGNGFEGPCSVVESIADNCNKGFVIDGKMVFCVARNNTSNGFETSGTKGAIFSCLSHDNGGDGFHFPSSGYACLASQCVAVGNTGDGFEVATYDMNYLYQCVSTHNTGYGFRTPGSNKGTAVYRCFHYSNTAGSINNTQAFQDLTALTADPWTSKATDDYEPNNTAGGGAELRAVFGVPGQTVSTDIGAVQVEQAAGGGGTTVPQGLHPIDSGINA